MYRSRYVQHLAAGKRRSTFLTLLLLLITSSAMAQASSTIIHEVPLWIAYGATLLWVVASVRAGYWLGSTKKFFLASAVSSTVDAVTRALIGLLAFLLAFTFDQAMDRFELRRGLYVDQVNAIEIAYRRAEYLPERYRAIIRSELIKYVDLRLGVIGHSEKIVDMVRESAVIHDTLNKTLEEMARDSQIDVAMLFVTSNALMNLLTVHNKRTTVALIYHLPQQMWIALYGLVMVAMVGMGHLFALRPKLNWALALILSISFSVVIMLITDLDRSGSHKSIIHFDQRAMADLKERLTNPDL